MTAPVVVWLQGGPGTSSLYGQFELNGPYRAVFDVCGKVKAKLHRHTWAKVFNIIYIVYPVGVGKSET